MRRVVRVFGAVFFYLILGVSRAQACTVCFADADAATSRGVKLAVLFLLGVVLFVLGAIAAVAFTWIRRARRIQPADPNFSLKNR